MAGAQSCVDYMAYLDDSIKSLAQQAEQNTFAYRGAHYSRETFTTAMLLSGSSVLRDLARAKGIDLRAFDNIIGQVQQLIIENTSKPNPGSKVIVVLEKLTHIR